MILTTSDAVAALGFVGFWGPDDNLKYPDGVTPPTESAINAKLAELKAAEPIRLLREQRNALLAATDWWASSDLVMSDERKVYRQALRDLPKVRTTPTKVKNVKWPTKP